jgi:predicted lipase
MIVIISQMYTKTYVDNLLAVGSSWDVASKAMFAQIGLPLQFEKMRTDIAATAAQLSYQLKVNKWYDRFSKAQIDSLYNNAAAALIQAHSAERNSFINAYLAPGQNDLNKNQSRNLYETSLSTSWNRKKDKSLFGITKKSLRLGVQSQQIGVNNQIFEYNFKTSTPGRIVYGIDRGFHAVSPLRFGQ